MKRVALLLSVVLMLCLVTIGCASPPTPEPRRIVPPPNLLVEESSIPHFPTETGTRWKYKITIGETEPLKFKTTYWPIGSADEGGHIVYGVRGRFEPLLAEKPQKSFDLVIKVIGPAKKQGPFEYRGSVELAVEEDDLGVFKDHSQIFWAIVQPPNPIVNEVVTYPPGLSSDPRGSEYWGSGSNTEGYSLRVVFFARQPGLSIGLGDDPKEEIIFNGIVPGGSGGFQLHFTREVEPAEEDDHYLSNGFTEEMWYEEGKGLVRLEQKVKGKISMTWELVKFTPGTR